MSILLIVLIPDSEPLKPHAILFFFIFILVQTYAMLSGKYSLPIANGFFRSYKAIDIYTHILGGFTFYIITKAVIGSDIIGSIIISFIVFGLFFEIFEYTFEEFLATRTKTTKGLKSISTISEPLPNILQDLVCNSIGIFIAVFYAIIFTPSIIVVTNV